MPERWQVTFTPDAEQLRQLGHLEGRPDEFVPCAIGTGDTPEEARADARRRIAAWLEAIGLLEEAERAGPRRAGGGSP